MLLQPNWNDVIPVAEQAVSSTTYLAELQQSLKPGWTVHVNRDGRLYYCNHVTQTSSWLPPAETWTDRGNGFPYGWEEAIDTNGKTYFINHLNKTTTYEDPRKDWTEEPPQPREVELSRHPELGFGFVAGSEKPVIVRFVTEGGPSVDKLQPGDQILIINGEDVKKAPRDHVIQLVRSCKETVKLTVCQPPLDNSARKSALLSAAKKAKLKSNPSRVRFAEGVVVNGSPLFPPSTFSSGDSSVPFMPNVLKVFLENGQTKSFKYDSNTTVKDVVDSLHQKLCIKAIDHFSLVVEHVKSLRRNKLTLLDPMEPLARIAARPGSHNLRCLFRVCFVPRDACDLAQQDLIAFEYLYMQCCNDVVQERYAPELKYDIALRLAALHIYQHALSNNMSGKITVKAIEREFGLERFVPVSLISTMKRKELRKLIGHFLKLNNNLSPSGQKSLTSLQAKLYYLNIISELPSYGAKCFSINDMSIERVILVSPKFGISQITGLRNSVPVPLADIEQMSQITVKREDEITRCVKIHFPESDKKELVLSLDEQDAAELVLVLQGYYRLLTGLELPTERDIIPTWVDDAAPSYHSQHFVVPATWSYGTKETINHTATFSVPPPYQSLHIKTNGHLLSSRIKPPLTDSINPNKTEYGVDNNMNKMTNIRNVNGTAGPDGTHFLLDDNRKTASGQVMDFSSLKFGCDLQSVVSMEILESSSCIDARNEEVMRRVAEMQELVQNSEQYLTQHQREESDSESSHISSLDSDAPGQLKHSDSLLLLAQGQKLISDEVNDAVRNIDLGDNEPSESDTDSMSTPTNSPSHRPLSGKEHLGYHSNSVLTASGSSFGLHSPDNLLPIGFHTSDHSVQDLLKRLQEDNTLPYNFAEGTLYLDPDIIDLTMIPPPITPDELTHEGANTLLPHLSLPPTPFADHSPLETELQIREQRINNRNKCSNLRTHNDSFLGDYSNKEGSIEVLSNSSVSDTIHSGQNEELLPDLDLNLDLEAFLASVTVPPPSHQATGSTELTPEEIMSFIIPPPPVNGNDIPTTLMKDDKPILKYQNEIPNEGQPSDEKTREKDFLTMTQHTDSSNFIDASKKGMRTIEYATINCKSFSCCGKKKASPQKNANTEDTIRPPPRNGHDMSKPPARPPKSVDHLKQPSIPPELNSLTNRDLQREESPPPLLPPRNDSPNHKPPQNAWLPHKKLSPTPVLCQDTPKKTSQHSPVPIIKAVRCEHSDNSLVTTPRSYFPTPYLRNGHIISNAGNMPQMRELLFSKSNATLVGLLERLDEVIEQCSKAQAAGGGACMDEARFQAAKELLTNEARQLVTASKLFVKSATDASGKDLTENLANCLYHLRRLTDLASDVTVHTTSPLQTRNLIVKIRDVTEMFNETVSSALGMTEVPETLLLHRAESLASVLATLLRSLRVFSP
ncbi:uncharacterized protein LOC126299428 isoform X1 [Schistocerca gregaria]|uniref:uncharacterized protein LOC126299428 isoform X1 n=1 Tax=Schistocerca gregaria TaxID=7010 RepID=UPI00211DD541|nr:uncharacterized protein LOC126299428 isoform X1 [Schistocerca gregaria]